MEHEVSPEAPTYQVLIKRNLRGDFSKVEVLLRQYLTLMIIVTVAERCLFPS